jgi:hypothetical protein
VTIHRSGRDKQQVKFFNDFYRTRQNDENIHGSGPLPLVPVCCALATVRAEADGREISVSFRQGCVKGRESRFLWGQEAADGGSADLKPSGDFGFADSLPM